MLLTAVVSFLLGVFFAPVVRPMFRPMMLEIMKAWIVASDEARRATAQAREDMEDIAEEARAEVKTRRSTATAQNDDKNVA